MDAHRPVLLVLTAVSMTVAASAWPTYAANVAPRMVGAQMLDQDHDDHADALRLTYSEKIWHRKDTDGKYPFTVANYRVRWAGGATGSRHLTLVLNRSYGDSEG